MWELVIDDREKILPIIFELSEQSESKHGVKLRHMRRRDLSKEIKVFGEVYNAAWKRNWGFVPYSDETSSTTPRSCSSSSTSTGSWSPRRTARRSGSR